MDTGTWDEIRGKLGLARASKATLIGMAAILALVAVAVVHVLTGPATASDFEIRHDAEAVAADSPDEPVPQQSWFVHVSGAVADPGLYEVAQGSRVADAVMAAGGFAEGAAEDSVNLARPIEDGEHVIVARQGDSTGGSIAGNGEGQALQAGQGGLVNINTATAEQLQALPGIGAATAQKIVADRAANGAFKSADDLLRVSGIGEKKLASIKDMICV